MSNIGPLLTDSQLREWRNRIHVAWEEANRAAAKAARKEARLRKYLHRHYKVELSSKDES